MDVENWFCPEGHKLNVKTTIDKRADVTLTWLDLECPECDFKTTLLHRVEPEEQ